MAVNNLSHDRTDLRPEARSAVTALVQLSARSLSIYFSKEKNKSKENTNSGY
jgi:hypothetical protein